MTKTLIGIGLLIPGLAFARPPEGADMSLAPWFHSLQSPSGMNCCSMADCRGTKDYPIRIVDGGYEALVHEHWMKVPPSVVSDREDNPTGDYVTCVQENYYESGEPKPRILCLFKAPGT